MGNLGKVPRKVLEGRSSSAPTPHSLVLSVVTVFALVRKSNRMKDEAASSQYWCLIVNETIYGISLCSQRKLNVHITIGETKACLRRRSYLRMC
jgi:hypothetical protein